MRGVGSSNLPVPTIQYVTSEILKFLGHLTRLSWRNRLLPKVQQFNRQARSATKAYFKYKFGLTLTDAERKTISHLAAPVQAEGGQA